MAPYPFAGAAAFTLVRRVLPKRAWTSAELRRALVGAPADPVAVELVA